MCVQRSGRHLEKCRSSRSAIHFSTMPDSAFPVTRDIHICEKGDDALYIGSPWTFQELNVTVHQPAQTGWQAVVEFSAAESAASAEIWD